MNSLNWVGQNTNVSSSILYDVLKENYEQRKQVDWDKQGQKIALGIDEHSHHGRRMALTITNLSQRNLLAVCRNDRVTTLKNWLNQADKSRIEEEQIGVMINQMNNTPRKCLNYRTPREVFEKKSLPTINPRVLHLRV